MVNRCPHPFGHTDSARRMADNVNMHYAAVGWDAVGKFVAIALADGSSDHVLYPSKPVAVSHQSNEFHYCYVKILPGSMDLCEAEIFLSFNRKAYDNGFRLADPKRDVIVRGRPIETVNAMMKQMRRK